MIAPAPVVETVVLLGNVRAPTPMPPCRLPEMTLRCAAVEPPTRTPGALTWTPMLPLAIAAVPAGLTPTRLPSTIDPIAEVITDGTAVDVSVELPKFKPLLPLPEITLPVTTDVGPEMNAPALLLA